MHTVDVANTIITHDAGSPRDQLSPFWEATAPLSYIGWGKTTQLGYGLGLAMGAKLAPARQALHQRLGRRRHRLHRHGLRDRRARAHPDPVGPAQQLLDGDRAAGHAGRDREVPAHRHQRQLRRHGQGVRRLRRARHRARARSSRRSSAASRRPKRARRPCSSSSPRRPTTSRCSREWRAHATHLFPVGFSGGARGRGVGAAGGGGGRGQAALRRRAVSSSPRRRRRTTAIVREPSASSIPPAPHYNTLLRVDPNDPTGTKVVPDVAESWSVRPMGRTYTLKLRRGVKFHDGAELTSARVKATYDKIVIPAGRRRSFRRGPYADVEAVQAPDPYTIVFRLKWPSASMAQPVPRRSTGSTGRHPRQGSALVREERDGHGTVHVRGARAAARTGSARRSPTMGQGQPTSTAIAGLREGHIGAGRRGARRARHIQFADSPRREHDTSCRRSARRPWCRRARGTASLLVTGNPERSRGTTARAPRAEPRRSIGAAQALSRIAGSSRWSAACRCRARPTPPRPRSWRSSRATAVTSNARAEARRLLKEAGVPDGLLLLVQEPRRADAVRARRHLADRPVAEGGAQRQARVPEKERPSGTPTAGAGDFEVVDRHAVQLHRRSGHGPLDKFQSTGVSDSNLGATRIRRSTSSTRSSRARRIRKSASGYVRESRSAWSTRKRTSSTRCSGTGIVPHSAKLKGWTITPSALPEPPARPGVAGRG